LVTSLNTNWTAGVCLFVLNSSRRTETVKPGAMEQGDKVVSMLLHHNRISFTLRHAPIKCGPSKFSKIRWAKWWNVFSFWGKPLKPHVAGSPRFCSRERKRMYHKSARSKNVKASYVTLRYRIVTPVFTKFWTSPNAALFRSSVENFGRCSWLLPSPPFSPSFFVNKPRPAPGLM
jgi:hypothetical protein